MKDLNLFKNAIEDEVKARIEAMTSSFESETNSVELEEIGLEIDGVDYIADVEADVIVNFRNYYENDKYGIDVYMGKEVEIISSEFSIKNLYNCETEEYIINDFKQTDKW